MLIGEDLLEVHSLEVVIDEPEGASKEIYGYISVGDSTKSFGDDGFIHIFEASKQNAVALSACGLLPLSGPNQCIRMNDGTVIVARLYEKSTERQICDGSISLKKVGNHLLSHIFRSDYGHAEIHYSLFNSAIEARVEVVFIPPCSSKLDQYTIYGDISVIYGTSYFQYNNDFFEKYRTRLFELPEENAMAINTTLRDDTRIVEIPLSRSTLCAPLEMLPCLHIDTRMWANGQRFCGTALFCPWENLEDVTVTEKFQFGEIEVRVKWVAVPL